MKKNSSKEFYIVTIISKDKAKIKLYLWIIIAVLFILFFLSFSMPCVIPLATLFLIIYVFLKVLNKLKNKCPNKLLKNNLKWFLYENKLYTSENTTDINGNKVETITNCLKIGFKISNKGLILRAYKNADTFNRKSSELSDGLQALLNLPLYDKIENIAYTDYIFRNSDNRIEVSSSDLKGVNNSMKIRLSSHYEWNIQKQPHLLLSGGTGSGKTTFLNYLLLQIECMQSELYICDPKRSDLSSLKYIVGSEYVGSSPNEIAKITRIAKEIMLSRFENYKDNPENFKYGASFVEYGLNPVFIVFDELGAFRAEAEKKVFEETMKNLTEIILKGREMGVFCVLSTQQPNANNIPTELRDNLSVRVALGSMSKEGYRMVFGDFDTELQSVNEIGCGYIYLDGLGWQNPKYFKSPYLDYKKIDFMEEMRRLHK